MKANFKSTVASNIGFGKSLKDAIEAAFEIDLEPGNYAQYEDDIESLHRTFGRISDDSVEELKKLIPDMKETHTGFERSSFGKDVPRSDKAV